MGATGPSDITFYVTTEARNQIRELSGDSGLSLGQVSVAALSHYRGLIDAGEADRPVAARLGGGSKSTARVVVAGQLELAQWIARMSAEWGTTRGLILMAAVGYFAAAAEAGRVRVPTPQTARKHTPKQRPTVSMARPKGTPTPVDRAVCPECSSMRMVTSAEGQAVLAAHTVWARNASHPRGGEHLECPGSGTKPDRVVHSAEIALHARRSV
jgi:hypothetical protein